MPPALLRRAHNKTRYGCLGCKKQRKKCDEQKPTCGGCSRRKVSCSLASLALPAPTPTPGPSPHSLDLPSLELLHHYTYNACLTLSVARSLHIWQFQVPRMAFGTNTNTNTPPRFLMQGLLAVSALHLALLQPSRGSELRRRAVLAAHTALPSYRALAAETKTSTHINAVMAFGVLVLPYTLALNGSAAAKLPSRGHVELHWFYLARGLAQIVGRSWGELKRGPFGSLFAGGELTVVLEDNPDDVHFVRVYGVLGEDGGESAVDEDQDQLALKVCRAALFELRRVAAIQSSPVWEIGCLAIIYMWPATIDQRFITLIEERRPEALAVLAHFCVLLKKLEGCWFLGNLGRDMLVVIQETLGEKWDPWIKWAVEYPSTEDLETRGVDGAIAFRERC